MGFAAILFALIQEPAGSADAAAPQKVDFVRDVQPLLKTHCLSCHGPEKQKGQLRLDSRDWTLRGGVSGKILLPGDAKASPLYSLLVHADPETRMPQKADPLPKAAVDLLRAWIDQGAAWPDHAAGTAKVEIHWAYVKPTASAPPGPQHPIDAFLAAEREAQGLKPRPEASKETLIRRLTLDLLGLPPTADDLRAYVADASPGAYERLVDRLLADPRHGERWGRHWMDVWRYSDWAGFQEEVREGKRHVWRWRDWIVESVNADKGYDRMVAEMLAGDELAPDDPEVLRATGFLARNWMKSSRDTWLMNVVEHTSKAFLATTLNCARCHNHFFDPLSQKEYYQFRAFFETHDVRTDLVPGETNADKNGLARSYDADAAAPTWLYVRGEEKNPDKSTLIVPATPRALGGTPLKIEPVPLPLSAIAPDKRDFVTRDLLAAAAKEAVDARSKLDAAALAASKVEDPAKSREAVGAALDLRAAEAKRDALDALFRVEKLDKSAEEWKAAATAAAAAQRRQALAEAQKAEGAARQALAKKKDDAGAKKKLAEAEQAVEKAAKAAAETTTAYTPRKIATYPSSSSGRRLALARWIGDKENPIAARVAVNHVWARHFGKPLVSTVFDFGAHGRAPSHPKLLDWLALEFMNKGWSLKALHRRMVTSEAYRMESNPEAASLAKDPENRWLWRMNARRMEGEAVRDSLLQIAGMLDLARGGPELDHKQGLTIPRRSLYFRHAAEKQMDFLQLFDAASVLECYERTESIVPQQALALANSGLAQDVARRIAKDLAGSSDFVRAAYERVLGRGPSTSEAETCAAFLKSQAELLASPLTPFAGKAAAPPDPAARAREGLVLVLLNHHEFVTIR